MDNGSDQKPIIDTVDANFDEYVKEWNGNDYEVFCMEDLSDCYRRGVVDGLHIIVSLCAVADLKHMPLEYMQALMEQLEYEIDQESIDLEDIEEREGEESVAWEDLLAALTNEDS